MNFTSAKNISRNFHFHWTHVSGCFCSYCHRTHRNRKWSTRIIRSIICTRNASSSVPTVDINVRIFVVISKISSNLNDYFTTSPIILGVSNRSTTRTRTPKFNCSNIFIHNINYVVGNLPSIVVQDGDNDGTTYGEIDGTLVVGWHDGWSVGVAEGVRDGDVEGKTDGNQPQEGNDSLITYTSLLS